MSGKDTTGNPLRVSMNCINPGQARIFEKITVFNHQTPMPLRRLLFSLFFSGLAFLGAAQTVVPADTLAPRPARRGGLEIEGETVICPGTITALKVAGQYKRYEWSTGHTTPNVTIYKPGTYTVTVTTEGGCELTASVTVRYSEDPCL
jgi:hypothetical protein